MSIQLKLNIESALHHCSFNFCCFFFSEMKLYEERAWISTFNNQETKNAEHAFSIFVIPKVSNAKIDPAFSISYIL